VLSYHYTLTPDDNGTLLIQFPDVPEAAAVAESEAEAPAQAAEGLEAALHMYLDAHRPLPIPSPSVYASSHVVHIRIPTILALPDHTIGRVPLAQSTP